MTEILIGATIGSLGVILSLALVAGIIRYREENTSRKAQKVVMVALPGIVHAIDEIHRQILDKYSREEAIEALKERIRRENGVIHPQYPVPEVQAFWEAKVAAQAEFMKWDNEK